MPRRRVQSEGFALLLTLALLAIAAVALAGIGRRSFRSAITAQRAETDLQRHWAQRSIEDTFLPQLTDLLAPPRPAKDRSSNRNAQPAAASPRLVDGRLMLERQLGALATTIVISDEQAKLNVNHMLLTQEAQKVSADLQRLLAVGGLNLELDLRPLQDFDRQLNRLDRHWPAIASFEQVLAARADAPSIQTLADHVTLWGDGRLSYRHVSLPVLEIAMGADLPPRDAQRLVAHRSEHPESSLDEAMSSLKLNNRQRKRVEARLTDQSRCLSLWTTYDDGRRHWRHLTVVEGDPKHNPQVNRLIW